MKVSQVAQISDYMIDEKTEELQAEYVADDSYLNDALCDCFAEIRALYNANTTDDKLAAIDNFKNKLAKVIKNEDLVRSEAFDFYKNQLAWD